MAYDEALLFSYIWILPVTSFLLHCAKGSVNGFFSSKVHTTHAPSSWQPPATTLLATVILTANFIDYSRLNYLLLHVRIRRSIQRPLFMGPMSLHRGLFGIRALRAVSVFTRATI